MACSTSVTSVPELTGAGASLPVSSCDHIQNAAAADSGCMRCRAKKKEKGTTGAQKVRIYSIHSEERALHHILSNGRALYHVFVYISNQGGASPSGAAT